MLFFLLFLRPVFFQQNALIHGRSPAIHIVLKHESLRHESPIQNIIRSCELQCESFYQGSNIFHPIPKCRHIHCYRFKTVIKILSEITLFTNSAKFLLVAAITRTSVYLVLASPTRMNSPVSKTLSNLTCVSRGVSPISSRKMVPLCASSKYPFRSSPAPVNEPFYVQIIRIQ